LPGDRGDLTGTAVTLRGAAGLAVLASLASFFHAGRVVFELPSKGAIFGGILFQLFYILAVYSVAHVLVIRARNIEALKQNEIFMLPLGAVLMRMVGEAYAAFVAFVAIGGGLFVWFTSQKVSTILGPLHRLFPVRGDTSFIGGIEFMFSGILLAVAAIIVSYMIAEILTIVAGRVQPVAAMVKPRSLPQRNGIRHHINSR